MTDTTPTPEPAALAALAREFEIRLRNRTAIPYDPTKSQPAWEMFAAAKTIFAELVATLPADAVRLTEDQTASDVPDSDRAQLRHAIGRFDSRWMDNTGDWDPLADEYLDQLAQELTAAGWRKDPAARDKNGFTLADHKRFNAAVVDQRDDVLAALRQARGAFDELTAGHMELRAELERKTQERDGADAENERLKKLYDASVTVLALHVDQVLAGKVRCGHPDHGQAGTEDTTQPDEYVVQSSSTVWMCGHGEYHVRIKGQPGIRATIVAHDLDGAQKVADLINAARLPRDTAQPGADVIEQAFTVAYDAVDWGSAVQWIKPLAHSDPAEIGTARVHVDAIIRAATRGLADAGLLATRADSAAQITAYQELLHYIWLHVNWRSVTGKCTTEQRELWADAIETVSEHDHPGDGATADRWWREPAAACVQCGYTKGHKYNCGLRPGASQDTDAPTKPAPVLDLTPDAPTAVGHQNTEESI